MADVNLIFSTYLREFHILNVFTRTEVRTRTGVCSSDINLVENENVTVSNNIQYFPSK